MWGIAADGRVLVNFGESQGIGVRFYGTEVGDCSRFGCGSYRILGKLSS